MSANQASVQSAGVVVIPLVEHVLGNVKEILAGLVDIELAVYDPALRGGAFDGVPDVSITADDGVVLLAKVFCSLEELLPTRSDLGLDYCRIIGSQTSFAMERR
jgi:hypothetical protein